MQSALNVTQADPTRARLRVDAGRQASGAGSGGPVLLQEVYRVADEAAVQFQPQLRMPWEAGIWSSVFTGQVSFSLGHSMNVLRPVPMPAAPTRNAPESVPPAPLKDSATRPLKAARIRASNEDIRASALRKLKVLVLLDPGATRAGALMKNKVGPSIPRRQRRSCLT